MSWLILVKRLGGVAPKTMNGLPSLEVEIRVLDVLIATGIGTDQCVILKNTLRDVNGLITKNQIKNVWAMEPCFWL